jgi:transposase-like protein
MKNRFAHRAKLSENELLTLVDLFAKGETASRIAKVMNLNRNTINRYLKEIRLRIADKCRRDSPFRSVDPIELKPDTSQGPESIANSDIVFGIFMRDGQIYTDIIPDCQHTTLRAIVRGDKDVTALGGLDSQPYDGVADLRCKKHTMISHAKLEDGMTVCLVEGVDVFWEYLKGRMTKFRGVKKTSFELFLKETEFRFNHRSDDLKQLLLGLIQEKPLF